jgi:hypothetical protein
VVRRDPQAVSEATDQHQARLAFSTFDEADLRKGDSGGVRQLLLSQPTLVSELTNPCAKRGDTSGVRLGVAGLRGHIGNTTGWSLCGPLLLSSKVHRVGGPCARPCQGGRVPELPDFDVNDFRETMREALESVRGQLGRVNLVVVGKTGVGKSTLINAVFGSQVAATGLGRPVTTDTEYFEHPDVPLGIYDSQGFETGASGDALLGQLE